MSERHPCAARIGGSGRIGPQSGQQRQQLLLQDLRQSVGGSRRLRRLTASVLIPLPQGQILRHLRFQRGTISIGLLPSLFGLAAQQKGYAGHNQSRQRQCPVQIYLRHGAAAEKRQNRTGQQQHDAGDWQQRRGCFRRGNAVQPGAAGGIIIRVEGVRGIEGFCLIRRFLRGFFRRLCLPQSGLGLLQRGALALQPGQRILLRQRPGGFHQPCGAVRRLLRGCLRGGILLRRLLLLQLLPQRLLGLQLLLLPGQALQLLAGGIGLLGQAVHLRQLFLQVGDFPLQHRDLTGGAVAPAAVQLLFQPVPHLGVGHIFLAGGNESGDAPFQLCVTVHRQCALPDKSAALKDFPGDT